MRYYVVQDGDYPGPASAFDNTCHPTQTRRHERQPEFDDEDIGLQRPYGTSGLLPAERIDRVKAAHYPEILRGGLSGILGLAGK